MHTRPLKTLLTLPHWRYLLGPAASVALLVALFREVPLGDVTAELSSVRWAWLTVAIPTYLGSLALRGARWRALIQPVAPISHTRATRDVILSSAANVAIPVRVGDAIRLGAAGERGRRSWPALLGSLVVERLADGLALSALLVAGLLLAGYTPPLAVLAAGSAALFGGLVFALFLLRRHRTKLGRLGALSARVPGPARRPSRLVLLTLIRTARSAASSIRARRAVVLALLTAATWIAEGLAYVFVARALGIDLGPATLLALIGAANLGAAIPGAVGGIGPFEFFGREVVLLAGVSSTQATALMLLIHAGIIAALVLTASLILIVRMRPQLVAGRRGSPEPAPAREAIGGYE